MAREVPLTQGKVALVDDADYELVSRHAWCAAKNRRTYYAQTTVHFKDGKGVWRSRVIRMHRLIMAAVAMGHDIDHRDRNGLNNQRYNLRPATRVQNRANTHGTRASGIKGVHRLRNPKLKRPWMARVGYQGKQLYLGTFATDAEAARAYDAKARELFGEFARLNFPETLALPAERSAA